MRDAPEPWSWTMLALALLVGAGAGLGAVAFRYMIVGFTYLFTGHRDYSAPGHAPNPLVPGLGIWFVRARAGRRRPALRPAGRHGSRREARGHGVPEVMLAVAERGGRIRPQVAVVKSLASALCIGSGGSVGREGPIVQIGSALGLGARPAAARARVAAAAARRLRRRRRDLGDVQRADRRRVLRARADPARLRGRVVRRRRALAR